MPDLDLYAGWIESLAADIARISPTIDVERDDMADVLGCLRTAVAARWDADDELRAGTADADTVARLFAAVTDLADMAVAQAV